ncbi:MAG: DsbA family oxidoreductase [Gammaproteobacteria bacterium]|nr:DsbA family oxidoreductase [Gammaproteobacteria bacterium]
MLIEIYSDVICPWCYVGKRRLDKALTAPACDDVDVVWRPFQLYPNLPSSGMDRDEYLARRYGEKADRARAPRQIVEEGEDAGIAFDYGAIGRMPNTLTAHRLLDYAERRSGADVQHELAEVLFRYYFCEGRDVGDVDTLCEAASSRFGCPRGASLPRRTRRRGVHARADQERVRDRRGERPVLPVGWGFHAARRPVVRRHAPVHRTRQIEAG